ncbi:MAG: ribosome maturation factor RimP [Actinomycetaceae bacterium]|nr:ribosome maturation factor RimP [Arcanobacterium sp.]MDD7687314.1 ribosome maturation factor RimP [Actinomycetaceae bacterium]MDY5274083.1 ribosome maturation factor RimP [Arcanobacterium sp.]
MAKNETVGDITAIVAPLVQDMGLYLEGVALKRAGKYVTVRVTVDLESGAGAVDSEQLEQLSRAISTALDAADPISGAYTLEVSTPGAERELTELRHYSRAIGHLAHIILTDGTDMTARVQRVSEESIVVTTYAEKNKQRVATGEHELTFSEIRSARIVVEL